MPNQELFLADEDGHRLPPGAGRGELVVRGAHVMRIFSATNGVRRQFVLRRLLGVLERGPA